jgi:flagellar assembly factor FliW
MLINTTRFGEVEISEESIIHIPEGMICLPSSKRYILLEDHPDVPLKWLQSLDNPALAFIVINPLDFFANYDIELADEDAEMIGLKDPSDAALLTTVTVDKKAESVTTNLLGPIVINSKDLNAKQVVLQDERYGTKHLIGERANADAPLKAAGAA